MFAGLRYHVIEHLCAMLPARWCERIAVSLADGWCRRARRDREAVQANLALVLGADRMVSVEMVREVFRNFARYLYEFFSAHQGQRVLVTLQRLEYLQRALAAKKGVILLSAHLGNWEFGGVMLHRLGCAISVVALPHAHPQVDRCFNRQRRRCGVDTIPLGRHAARASMACLRQGGLVGMVGDRLFGNAGVMVPFCGASVTMPKGPALLSVRTGAPMVPTFLLREGLHRFRLSFGEPLWPQPERSHAAEVQRLAVASASAIERAVQQHPMQWLVLQPVVSR